ncbi:MAG: 3-phosphoshikimate 1-carboxyvinyltransferase [Oscillospiraceae bacterium]|nr:3-phosphoshikimate 1-carboxyvinyltransferase [Oscillospiraceae bacterium]
MTVLPGPIRGDVEILPSKSVLHRLLILAALAQGETFIHSGPTEAEDVAATMDCLTALGAVISRAADGFSVRPIDRGRLPDYAILPCRESGSTLRFLLPVVAALGIRGAFHMEGRLAERPLGPLVAELERHGVTVSWSAAGNIPPLGVAGQLRAGAYVLPGDVSSQFVSGLLMAFPLLDGANTLTITGAVESAGYIEMTREAIALFAASGGRANTVRPYNGRCVTAEGDWSNGAFWLAAGAMPGGDVRVRGLDRMSVQGDRAMFSILAQMGAQVGWDGDVASVTEDRRRGVEIDAGAIPDLIPVLSAVAAVSEGETVVGNAARLRLKESDRLRTTALTLRALGADITEEEAGLRIRGVPRLSGGVVDSMGDHRIAMMAAVASAAAEGPVTITGAQAVRKSYPQFWDVLASLGKQVVIEEA